MNLLKECWLESEEYPNYLISNMGRIKSFGKNKHNIIRKLLVTRRGYLACTMRNKKGFVKGVNVGRLVLTCFVRSPKKNEQVNHINGIKSDNRVVNLEWCTASENVTHGYRNNLISRRGIKNPAATFTETEVLELRSAHLTGVSMYRLAKDRHCSYSTMHSLITEKSWSHI